MKQGFRPVLAIPLAIIVLAISGCGGSGGGASNYIKSTILLTDKIESAQILKTWYGDPIPESTPMAIDVTTTARLANHLGTRQVPVASEALYLATIVGSGGSFAINSNAIFIQPTDTWGEVINKINGLTSMTGVRAEAEHNGAVGQIHLYQTQYGRNFKINLTDANGIIQTAAGSVSAEGVNAISSVTLGSFDSETFTAGANGSDGLTMTDSEGNMIRLTVSGNAVSTYVGAIVVN